MKIQIKRQLLDLLEKGYPERTAVALCRIPYTTYIDELSKDVTLIVDVEESKALGLQPVLDTMYQSASIDSRSALAYLERRAKEDWSKEDKITLQVERAKEDILNEIKQKLPEPLFREVITYLAED